MIDQTYTNYLLQIKMNISLESMVKMDHLFLTVTVTLHVHFLFGLVRWYHSFSSVQINQL